MDVLAERLANILREQGYAVVFFSSEDRNGVSIDELENALVERGWDFIDMNKEN